MPLVTPRLDAHAPHYVWDESIPPQLTISPGATVEFETRDASDGFYGPNSVSADAAYFFDTFKGMPLTGPVYIEGARPGDVLQVDVLEVEPGPYAWTAIMPGFGLLQDEFSEPYLRIWDLADRRFAYLGESVRIPLEPFCGVMGVAPAQSGEHSTVPPLRTGGNMDIKHLVVGSKLYLPIEVEGGLFSLGDAHGGQGDGEVCGSALETSARAVLRFRLRNDLTIAEPQLETARRESARSYGQCYVATGRSTDLMLAAKQAIHQMLDHLASKYQLSHEDAYVLSSVAVDLRIGQVVNAPYWIVNAFLPLSIFASHTKAAVE